MKIWTPGHKYELANFEEPQAPGQLLQFIEKEERIEVIAGISNRTGEFRTVRDGTTNEEVLLVLIDRMQSLSAKLPSRETSLAITKCEEALMWLERRTANRKARNVEGTPKA